MSVPCEKMLVPGGLPAVVERSMERHVLLGAQMAGVKTCAAAMGNRLAVPQSLSELPCNRQFLSWLITKRNENTHPCQSCTRIFTIAC